MMLFHESKSRLRRWRPRVFPVAASHGPGDRDATPRNGHEPVEATCRGDDGGLFEQRSVAGRLAKTETGVAPPIARHARPRSVAQAHSAQGANHRTPRT